jgi:hypothetical protein
MKKICRVHNPHKLYWKIETNDGLFDYLWEEFNVGLDILKQKNDILWNDFDVLISTEIIENYDLIVKYVRTEQSYLMYECAGQEFFFNKSFSDYFDLYKEPKDLYMKGINDL